MIEMSRNGSWKTNKETTLDKRKCQQEIVGPLEADFNILKYRFFLNSPRRGKKVLITHLLQQDESEIGWANSKQSKSDLHKEKEWQERLFEESETPLLAL